MGNIIQNVINSKSNSLGQDFSQLAIWDKFDFVDHKANIWNDVYVKLPFCSANINESTNRAIWETVMFSLNHLTRSLDACKSEEIFEETRKAILKYCPHYETDRAFNFTNLFFLIETFSASHEAGMSSRDDLRLLLKKMIESALSLPKLISQPIPMLKKGMNHSVSFNSQQCASLLANCFFCTFPSVRSNKFLSNANFIRLYTDEGNGRSESKIEKLKCILHYFHRVLIQTKENNVKTFSRHSESTNIKNLLEGSHKPIRYPIFELRDKIEDCQYATQVDFANSYLGGGVLGNGCVQEEIRFAISPEMIVGLILAESLDENEAFYFTGCERFSNYTGYASSFKFTGDFRDKTLSDEYRRVAVHVVAIDALRYKDKMEQFSQTCIKRELLKCYAGSSHSLAVIATGNWGCGAFNGIVELKYLIQLIAASQSDRTLIYSVIGSQETIDKLNNINKLIVKRVVNVSQLYKLLIDVGESILHGRFPSIDINNLDFNILLNH